LCIVDWIGKSLRISKEQCCLLSSAQSVAQIPKTIPKTIHSIQLDDGILCASRSSVGQYCCVEVDLSSRAAEIGNEMSIDLVSSSSSSSSSSCHYHHFLLLLLKKSNYVVVCWYYRGADYFSFGFVTDRAFKTTNPLSVILG
jgi:hypothetical protein